ncbi:MAG: hypothetical protein U5O39_09290 [Gammaproteobacteria bacterium]|nr:hypothetical protein [Gammaproteobacteria bacterium]
MDPFEVTIRAVVGQQVSVKGATTIMGRIAQTFGEEAGGSRYFPRPSSLASLDPGELPMPRQRAEAIRELSRRVAVGEMDLATSSPAELQTALVAIKGIGPWTARYAAMRAAGIRMRYCPAIWCCRRVANLYLGIDNEQALLERAEAWRPWRAYAGVHLRSIAGDYKRAGKGKS